MDSTYWHRQTADKPLFPELLWSRPENKRARGKLLIIGGNLHGFAAPAEAYVAAERAGAGTIRVILPDTVQKLVGGFFENALFAASTPSGSFGQQALGELLEQSVWADGVLLAGDFGRNSETAILLEKFIAKYSGQLTITKDAVDYFKDAPKLLLDHPDTTIVLSLAQLQKLGTGAGFEHPFTFGMSLIQLIETLHAFTEKHAASIIVKHLEQMLAVSGGQVSSTHLSEDIEIWRVRTAAHAAVWRLQNPARPFEALTTAIVEPPNP